MLLKVFVSFFVLFDVVLCSKHDIYAGNTVYAIKCQSESDADILNSISREYKLDEWQSAVLGARDAHVMVEPKYKEKFLGDLQRNAIEYSVLIEDVASILESKDAERSLRRNSGSLRAATNEDYPRYQEVMDYIAQLAETYADVVTLVTAGPSFDGRDVKYLKISTTNFTDLSKPIVYMQAGIHAREWVTIPVPLYFLHKLLEDRSTENDDLLNNFDWIVLPIVNPDGYEYTHTNERLWRRTRSFNTSVSTECYGADANRNFDYLFNEVGTSSDPCANTYPGTAPFSEVETQYVRDILLEHLDRLQLFFDIHSYGNLVLYGLVDRLTPDAHKLHHLGSVFGAAVDAHKVPEALYYTVGSSRYILYGASGTAKDYALAIGIPFSYTLELPGMGEFNFEVPPEYINQINRETFEGIIAAARLALKYKQAGM